MNSPDKRKIQKFGLIALIFFGSLCSLGILRKKPFLIILFGFLTLLGIGFTLLPSHLKPIYNAWLKIAYFLGEVLTTLILFLSYYLVITPSALIKRLFGGAPLPIKPDKKSSSYWVSRTESIQPKNRFLKRY